MESVYVLIEHYAQTDSFRLKSKQIFDICRLISSNNYILQVSLGDSCKKTNLNHINNIKLRICRILFERLDINLIQNISTVNSLLDESLFSICCGYGYGNCNCIEYSVSYYDYLFKVLYEQDCKEVVEAILIKTLLNKLRHSFEINIDLIEKLLMNIGDKKSLYASLHAFDACILLKPNDNNIKNYSLQPPYNKGYSKHLNNSYFIKQQMLVKYDVIPVEERLDWLTLFLIHWTKTCAVRSSTYVSAATIVRYINFDEMTQNIVNYYEYLIKYGFVAGSSLNPVKWWTDLLDDSSYGKMLMDMMSVEHRNKIEAKLHELHAKYRVLFVEPLSLKMLCRNRIRSSMRSLSNKSLLNLNLPKHLLNYLLNNDLV